MTRAAAITGSQASPAYAGPLESERLVVGSLSGATSSESVQAAHGGEAGRVMNSFLLTGRCRRLRLYRLLARAFPYDIQECIPETELVQLTDRRHRSPSAASLAFPAWCGCWWDIRPTAFLPKPLAEITQGPSAMRLRMARADRAGSPFCASLA